MTAPATAERPARQWGADRRTQPLPPVPARPSPRAVGWNRAAIWLTLAAWALYTARTVKLVVIDHDRSLATVLPLAVYLLVVSALTASAVAYLIARQGYLVRAARHTRATRAELDAAFAEGQPSMTVLVPSYREESRVVRQTLLSAALQEYEGLSVVLLVDDPVVPSDDDQRVLLDEALALPAQVAGMLAGPAAMTRAALDEFDRESVGQADATDAQLGRLSQRFDDAAGALREMGRGIHRYDHTDDFLVEQVLERLASDFEQVADALLAAMAEGVTFSVERARQLHLRLVRVFDARLSAFQRKRFASLSHEPNKAMNLNAYLSLMGGTYREVLRAGEIHLDRVDDGDVADLVVPATELVLTLDADSVLLPEYCLRLVHVLQQPEAERVAVIQTPYSAFPGSPTRLERLAGATTDLQHRIHQGLTHYDATFWVGANAILRRAALDDISTTEVEHGRTVVRYIHDRTVIEDTESSIDLGAHDWKLYNYCERLSYSATPPDFGALAIQRQRWADGGLLILQKLLRQRRERKLAGRPMTAAEMFLRTNYLASIAWSSVALLLVLFYPFSQLLLSPIAVLAAAPYFVAQAVDLKASGYKHGDVARIYGFNLVLLPVNLAGAMRSVWQGVTGSKIAFARTPKLLHRTRVRPLFLIAPLALFAFSAWTAVQDVAEERWWHAAFAGLNASTSLWAMVALIGIGPALADIVTGTINFVYHAPKEAPAPAPVTVPWSTVLDRGA